MRVGQLSGKDRSWVDEKHLRLDAAHLPSLGAETVAYTDETDLEAAVFRESVQRNSVDVVHAYGRSAAELCSKSRVRFVASVEPSRARGFWPKRALPARLVTPDAGVPEAVAESFITEWVAPPARSRYLIGSTARRAEIRSWIERTYARLARFRDDLEWRVFEDPPLPEDLATLHVWVDAALGDGDVDGYVVEAMVGGMPTVAARTALNRWRSDDGRSAHLVPVNDANELAHAILAALFKPELGEEKRATARESIDRFDAGSRAAALLAAYRQVVA